MITAIAFVCMANSIAIIRIAWKVFWSKDEEQPPNRHLHNKEITNGDRTRS